MYNDYSLSLLKKYGWKEGDGLGKSNQGIPKPVRANLKFNNLGIGYQEVTADQDSKWANMYSSALSRLSVDKGCDVKVEKDIVEDQLNRLGYTSLSRGFRKSDVVIKDGLEQTVPEKNSEKIKSKKRKLNCEEEIIIRKEEDINESEITEENSLAEATRSEQKKKRKIGKSMQNEIEQSNKLSIEIAEETKSERKQKRNPDKSIHNEEEIEQNDKMSIEIADETKSERKQKKKRNPDKSIHNEEEIEQNDKLSIEIAEETKSERKLKKQRKLDKSIQNEENNLSDEISENKKLEDKKMKKKNKKLAKESKAVETIETSKDLLKIENSEISMKRKSKKPEPELINVDNLILPNSSFMTCHPSARFGLGMSGKLARAQKLYESEKLAIQEKNDVSLKAI